MLPSEWIPRPWRRHVTRAAFGLTVGMAVGLALAAASGEWRNLGAHLGAGALVSVVLMAGFSLPGSAFWDLSSTLPPRRAALALQARWIGVGGALVLAALLLLRYLLGPSAPQTRVAVLIFFLVCLLVLSLLAGQETAVRLADRTRSLEQARARAAFLALDAQLQPHTLFNALNTVTALIREDPDRAQDAVRRLARLLRRITEALDQETWNLGQELSLVDDYLALERIRFGARLHAELPPHGADDPPSLPPLLVLPLIENCFRHGFRTRTGECRLRLQIEASCLTVTDNGPGFPEGWHEGVGLRMVRERLESRGGRMRVFSPGEGASVRLEWA